MKKLILELIATVAAFFIRKQITADGALSTFSKAVKKLERVEKKIDAAANQSAVSVDRANLKMSHAVQYYNDVRESAWAEQQRLGKERARLGKAKDAINSIIS